MKPEEKPEKLIPRERITRKGIPKKRIPIKTEKASPKGKSIRRESRESES